MVCRVALCVLSMLPGFVLPAGDVSGYKGIPYGDGRHVAVAQKLPGKVECAFYDAGGEGLAYHDTEAKNQGSGGLNPANGSYLNEFRMGEGVDTSYTKYHDAIDKNPFEAVLPEENLLYVGWTEPGEWFRITVDVAKAGIYSGDFLYTSNRGGSISLDVDGKDATGPLVVPTTYNAAETVAWRQWHHWNRAKDFVRVKLPAGRSVLTVHILTGGNMNLQSFDFRQVPE
jgi:hypothetical protein